MTVARFATTPTGPATAVVVVISYPVTAVHYNGVPMQKIPKPWWAKLFLWRRGDTYWKAIAP